MRRFTMNSDRKYFRIEKLLLNFGGFSIAPNKSPFYNIYTLIVLFGCHFFYTVMITTAVLASDSEDNVDSGFYLSGTYMATILVIHTCLNRKRISHIFEQAESDSFAPSVERGAVEEEEKLLNEWNHSATTQGMLLIIGTMLSMVTQVTYSLMKRLSNTDPHKWKLGWAEKTAFLDITRSPNFEIMWLYQNFAYMFMVINASFGVAVIANCLHFVSVQFTILQKFIKRIPELSIKKARENNNNNISFYRNEYLKDAILFHLTISELTYYVIDTFSFSITVILTSSLGLLCFSAFRASMQPLNSIHTLSILLEAVTASLPAWLHCINGERLAEESQKVGKAVYEMNFVGTDLQFQKKMIVMIRRSQNIVFMKVGNVVDVSLELLVMIYRASFSAYMMLRTVNSKNIA